MGDKKKKNGWIAGILQLFFGMFGAGYIYNREYKRGIIVTLIIWVSMAISEAIDIVALVFLVTIIFSVIDTFKRAKNIDAATPKPKDKFSPEQKVLVEKFIKKYGFLNMMHLLSLTKAERELGNLLNASNVNRALGRTKFKLEELKQTNLSKLDDEGRETYQIVKERYEFLIPIFKEMPMLLKLLNKKGERKLKIKDLYKYLISKLEDELENNKQQMKESIILFTKNYIKTSNANKDSPDSYSTRSYKDIIKAYSIVRNFQFKDYEIDDVEACKSLGKHYKVGTEWSDYKIRLALENSLENAELLEYEASLEKGDNKGILDVDFSQMNGREFEEYLATLFGSMGYKVRPTPASNDQGADLIVEKDGEIIAIQAKCYKGSVGNKAVQEVTAAIKHYKADRGIVITTGKFTNAAFKLASSNNVELWDTKKLIEFTTGA